MSHKEAVQPPVYDIEDVPKSYNHAKTRMDWDEWKVASINKLQALLKKGTFRKITQEELEMI